MSKAKFLFLEHNRIRTFEDGAWGEASNSDMKRLHSCAIVPLSLLQLHTLKISDNLNDEEQRVQVEIRMFEEGNLQSDQEYTIGYIRHHLPSESSYLCEVFALSDAKAKEYFTEVITKTSSIDLIVPGFMVYKSLYATMEAKNDLFIYWGEDEAYAAIYQNGRYIAHRTLETLTTIAVETGLDLAKLKMFMTSKGLIEENYLPEELNKYILLQERLAKNLEKLAHTINHKRGLFGLTGIDRIFIDLEGGTIPGLEMAFRAYGFEIESLSPLTEEGIDPKETHDRIAARYFTSELESAELNLSPYERQAPWYQRDGGRFLAILASSSFLAFATPLALAWMINSEEARHAELSERLAIVQQETSSLSAKLKERQNSVNETLSAINDNKKEIALINESKETAELISQMHLKRQQFLIDAATEMGRYRLGALMMEQNSSKTMQLHVLTHDKKRDDVAKMMRGLYERGYSDVQTHEITLEEGMINSIVEVKR